MSTQVPVENVTGDTFNRIFTIDTAQCGCYWVRKRFGDVLIQCPIHAQASAALLAKFERGRKTP